MLDPSTNPRWIKLGQIMVEHFDPQQLLDGYGLAEMDLGWVGWLAYQYGDITLRGDLN